MSILLNLEGVYEDPLAEQPPSIATLVLGYRYFHPERKDEEILEIIKKKISKLKLRFYADGWCSLPDFEKMLSRIFVVPKDGYECIKMNGRPTLSEYLKRNPKVAPCFIMVYEHSIFVDSKLRYRSLKYVDEDPVVAVWSVSDTIGDPRVV